MHEYFLKYLRMVTKEMKYVKDTEKVGKNRENKMKSKIVWKKEVPQA